MSAPIVMQGFASTPSVDRDNDLIRPSAFELVLSDFSKNPRLHEEHCPRCRVGSVTSLTLSEQGLYVTAQLYSDSQVAKFVRNGALKGFSIKMSGKITRTKQPDGTRIITSFDRLAEISVCKFTANQDTSFTIVGLPPVDIEELDFRAAVYWAPSYVELKAKAHLITLSTKSYGHTVRAMEHWKQLLPPGTAWNANSSFMCLERELKLMSAERDQMWARKIFEMPLIE